MEIVVCTREGDKIIVDLEAESANTDSRYSTLLYINGQPHHLERLPRQQLLEDYILDADENYNPVSDQDGYCYMLVPASE